METGSPQARADLIKSSRIAFNNSAAKRRRDVWHTNQHIDSQPPSPSPPREPGAAVIKEGKDGEIDTKQWRSGDFISLH